MPNSSKKEEIEKMLTPKIEEPEELIKEVKVQDTGRQLIVQIPVQIAEALKINKGDIVIFKVPLKNIKEYSIKVKNIK